MTDRPRYLDLRPAPRPRQVTHPDGWNPLLDKSVVGQELKLHIDRLRDERNANDDRAVRATRREDEREAAYWRSRADGLGAGLAALRDALYALTGEEY
jgi:hypothetical protein